jgi:predicted acylesterase/phospholipase RssA
MKEFYEYSGIELHFFSLELNSFEIVDVSYKTFPDIPVIQSVHMSCALPMIISPVCFDGKCFVDGGVLSNYPINFCIENEKNVNEILGIKNIYDTAENTIINNESTILDYSIYFITKLLNNVGSRLKYTGDLPYELKNNALLMSVNRVKESLYSSDVRREMIEEGVISANTFLAELAEREENIKDVDVDVDVDAIVDAIVEEKKDEENNEK